MIRPEEVESLEELVLKAKKRAMRLLQMQDRTESKLRDKLKEDGYPESVIDLAVDYVTSFHYLDDRRYAATYIRYKQGQKSKLQLKMDLRKKGVSDGDIELALSEEYEDCDLDKIRHLLEKKHYDPENMDFKEKQRIMAYVLRRGFDMSDIKKCMGQSEYD